jgi:S-adenosylmethionine synthetase
MQNLVIEELKHVPVYQQKIEIVERKGLGHPDTICDNIANEISVLLCKEYIKRFGRILHHNIDKSLLSAGEAENKFGGGTVKKPMLLIIGDRATYKYGKEEIPVNEIAISAAKNWLKEHLRFLNTEKDIKFQVELKEGSAALTSIFKREKIGANDTSAAVGYAPYTPVESITYETEKFLNSKEFKKEFPETGEDVKIMVSRIDNMLDITFAMPLIDRFVKSEEDYFRKKEEIVERVKGFILRNFDFKDISVNYNTLDKRGHGVEGVYLTVTGTSAESADSGQVGRGNRANGVISLNRPASEEAAAGKNPVAHVGKIYNLLSFRIAEKIYEEVSGLKEVYVWLLSQIGQPIDSPKLVSVQTVLEKGIKMKEVEKEIKNVVEAHVTNINSFVDELIKGKVNFC